MDPTIAAWELARSWADAWNARSLERILAHYDEDVEFTYPAGAHAGVPARAVLRGRDRLRAHFAIGVRALRLEFRVVDVLAGPGTVGIVYLRETGALMVDCVELGADGRIVRASAYHGTPGAWAAAVSEAVAVEPPTLLGVEELSAPHAEALRGLHVHHPDASHRHAHHGHGHAHRHGGRDAAGERVY